MVYSVNDIPLVSMVKDTDGPWTKYNPVKKRENLDQVCLVYGYIHTHIHLNVLNTS